VVICEQYVRPWTIAKYLRIKMKPDEFPVSAEIPEKVLFIEHPGPKPAGGLPL
jgi:hypothetical protein